MDVNEVEQMEKNTIVLLVLGVLVLVALAQAFQLNGLKDKIAGGAIATAVSGSHGAASQAGSGSQQVKMPSNLDNLPQMVGGC